LADPAEQNEQEGIANVGISNRATLNQKIASTFPALPLKLSVIKASTTIARNSGRKQEFPQAQSREETLRYPKN
jgi:hypothetical protein